jgi:hypothetical protein
VGLAGCTVHIFDVGSRPGPARQSVGLGQRIPWALIFVAQKLRTSTSLRKPSQAITVQSTP